MTHDTSGYGLWTLVVLNSAIFLMFAFSFSKPQSPRDWRTFGAFAAFVVALFVEMYGFPLSIYLLSGWLQTKYPSLDLLSLNTGHLWSTTKAAKAPNVRQSRGLWGLEKLKANIRKIAELSTTRVHSP